jgi:hypothetical protein
VHLKKAVIRLTLVGRECFPGIDDEQGDMPTTSSKGAARVSDSYTSRVFQGSNDEHEATAAMKVVRG